MPRTIRCAAFGKEGKRCKEKFVPKGDKKYCSKKCANIVSNSGRAANFGKRDNEDAFDTGIRLAEMYYRLTNNDERELFLLNTLATATKDNRTRRAITLPALMKPDLDQSSLFFRKQKTYLTIAELMKRFCWYAYNRSVYDMVKCDRIMSPINSVKLSTYDMRVKMRKEAYHILTEDQIEDKMSGRPAWLIDYMNQMHRQAEDFYANDNGEIEIKHDVEFAI